MKIGVVLPAGSNSRYTDIRDMALQAEDAGLDSIWLLDHLFYRNPGEPTDGLWECWTMLSALAEATKTIELGTLVACASFRNPALLAKIAITLDEVSNGRFTLGLGAGWNKPEYEAFGFPYDHRVDRFEEILQIIVPLLREGRVNFQGKYYRALDCEIIPRGPTSSGPKLLIGATGQRMMQLTAKYADMWNTLAGGVESFTQPLKALKEACSEVERDYATIDTTAWMNVSFPELVEKPGYVQEFITGKKNRINIELQKYQAIGCKHVMLRIFPTNKKALAKASKEVTRFKTGG